ncbi:MAG TPA: hypothetical protein VJ044_02580 [Candidatus Hodarchaeales archaeon]|nr:hypothetical protein [Candidatus Hodarchaeales archaeon]
MRILADAAFFWTLFLVIGIFYGLGKEMHIMIFSVVFGTITVFVRSLISIRSEAGKNPAD